MDETTRNDADEGNPDWNRTISDAEAQRTAAQVDPDDLGNTAVTDSGLTAGGEGTQIGDDVDPGGGTPYTEGYVTGGAHHPTIADLPRDEEQQAP
jgi:hypothetical protein